MQKKKNYKKIINLLNTCNRKQKLLNYIHLIFSNIKMSFLNINK